MCLATTAVILGQTADCLPGLKSLIRNHCKRIAPTMAYAIGQANNHGTSEAAALFIGGTWLSFSDGDAQARKWASIGRRWLEDRASTLILEDGTFSQYSAVYHRLMLDTYSLVEVWRREHSLPPFSKRLQERLSSASRWLFQLIDEKTGDVPNLGANDGAQILQLTDAPFRDFRPSVQLATALFCNRRAFPDVSHCAEQLRWLNVICPELAAEKQKSESFDQGGFHLLRSGSVFAVLRYPRFRFRPSQADVMHLDLFVDGTNLLRDGGTFSYNPLDASDMYFQGCESHNTVQFDGRSMMPRLSRFLLGAWPKPDTVQMVQASDQQISASASYSDHVGAHHARHVELNDYSLSCVDQLSGRATTAVIRWRLQPGNWQIHENTALYGRWSLAVSANAGDFKMFMTEGLESRHYLEKSIIPVVEIHCSVPATIRTEIRF
jgi:hypothetical protein